MKMHQLIIFAALVACCISYTNARPQNALDGLCRQMYEEYFPNEFLEQIDMSSIFNLSSFTGKLESAEVCKYWCKLIKGDKSLGFQTVQSESRGPCCCASYKRTDVSKPWTRDSRWVKSSKALYFDEKLLLRETEKVKELHAKKYD